MTSGLGDVEKARPSGGRRRSASARHDSLGSAGRMSPERTPSEPSHHGLQAVAGDPSRLPHVWAWTVLVCGLIVVATATLYPFDFHVNRGSSVLVSARPFGTGLNNRRLAIDLLANVLLFVPVGFGVAAAARQRGPRKIAASAAALAVGFTLSLAVESLQMFLSDRSSSYSDLVANTAGALVGVSVFRRWGVAFLWRLSRFTVNVCSHPRGWALLFVGYAVFGVLLSLHLERSVRLHNWDSDYPLILGNEGTGDRPWRGQLSRLSIACRAVTGKEAR